MALFPLVARAGALADIDAALAAARASRGSLVLVTGEPGIGKSRLLAEAADRARGFRAVRSWCPPAATGAALRPWSQVVRALAGADTTAARLVSDSPYLTGLAAAGQRLPGDPEGARSQLAFDLAGLVAATAARRPVLLIIDDLHDADASSLRLLAELAPSLRGTPAVVLGAARDSDLAWQDRLGVRGTLMQLALTIGLQPLTPAEVAGLISADTGRPADPDLARMVCDRSGGNPFLATELIRQLAGRPGAAAAAESQVPGSVRAIAAARLAELPERAREAVAAAAVAGTRFRLDVLAEITGIPLAGLGGALADAHRAGLLAGGEAGEDRFRHDLIRDAIYDTIPAPARAALHARAGAVLASFADRGRDVAAAEAAHHLALAGPEAAGQAAEYARRAGDRAVTALAFEDAARWYERAEAGLSRLGADPPRRAEAALALGGARLAAGDRPGARDAFLRGAGVAREAGRPDLVARAALGFGGGPAGFEVSLLDGEQIALLEEAAASLPATEAALKSLVTARLSIASSLLEPDSRRLELASDATAQARAAGDDAALGAALAALCDATAGPDHCAERLARAGEIIAIAARLRDPPLGLLGRRLRLVALLETGAIAEWEAERQAYGMAAEALHHPLYRWYVPLWRGMRALLEGRLEDCRDALAEAAATGERAASRNAFLLVATQRWCLAAETGDTAALAALAHELEQPGLGGVWVKVGRALLYAQAGRPDESRAQLDAAAPLLAAMPRDSEWLPALAQVAETLALTGPHPVARWVYEALSPYAPLIVVEGICAAVRGPVQRHLGLLAAVLGDRAAAGAHFAAAAAAARSLGAARLADRIDAEARQAAADELAGPAAAGLARPAGGDRARQAAGKPSWPEPAVTSQSGPAETSRPGPAVTSRPGPAEASPAAVFRRETDVWQLAYQGREVRLRDSKGLRDIAILLARPGSAVAALDLAAVPPGGPARPGRPEPGELHQPADTGELLDPQARQAYRQRLRELAEEADQADAAADAGRSAKIAAEREFLVAALTEAYGLGGRVRRAGSPAERARTAVTARIKDAIRRIGAAHPALGRHLSRSVRTGTFCSYEPEQPVSWQL